MEKITPPFERPTFREMSKKEAQKYFDWYMSVLPDRIDILMDFFERTGGGTKSELDYTPESLIKLWKWFIPHVELVEKSPEELEREVQASPEWLKEEIKNDTHRVNTVTLAIAMDIAMYYGEVFVKNFQSVKWGFITKPKTHVNVNKPVLLGFKEGKYDAQMDVMRTVHILSQKVIEGNKTHELLYSNYNIWTQDVIVP
ncbi:hypothetical protein [Methanolobus tindarius]|jgi:hypothetical protein|nr:hypothetical protein [Methanolobus tindarius]